MTGLLRHGKAWRRRNGAEQRFEGEFAQAMADLERVRGRRATEQERADIRPIARAHWRDGRR